MRRRWWFPGIMGWKVLSSPFLHQADFYIEVPPWHSAHKSFLFKRTCPFWGLVTNYLWTCHWTLVRVFLLPAWKSCHNYTLILRTGLGKGFWWNVCSLLSCPACLAISNLLVLLLFCCVYSEVFCRSASKAPIFSRFLFKSSFNINVFQYFYWVAGAVEAGVAFGTILLSVFHIASSP